MIQLPAKPKRARTGFNFRAMSAPEIQNPRKRGKTTDATEIRSNFFFSVGQSESAGKLR